MTTTTLDHAKIAETAYLFWLDEGQPEGRDEAHWLKAIDALTPATPKKARKAPAKPAAKAKAAPKAKAAAPKAAKAKAAAPKKAAPKKKAAAK